MISMTRGLAPPAAPRAGVFEDMERDDNRRGPERDETDQFHRLVRQLVLDGDRRAAYAGRAARRTLAAMAPGATTAPLLGLGASGGAV
ncbi:hypothetical protein ACFXPW_33400 [Streptomyces goshikiensis]|uniref:hypothetical protein n=1 Tax=Streptomyces goshikiensis TaxID=1942 RepID=UPI00367985B8